jgi:hypothetical protein
MWFHLEVQEEGGIVLDSFLEIRDRITRMWCGGRRSGVGPSSNISRRRWIDDNGVDTNTKLVELLGHDGDPSISNRVTFLVPIDMV